MNLLLLAFGDRPENHFQANFAILSFLKDAAIKRVMVVTDRPDCYHLLQTRLEVLTIDAETLRQWQAPQQFFWRIKIKALELAAQRHPGEHLLYIDSDTFLAGELSGMQAQLDAGHSIMHVFEHALGNGHNRTTARMLQVLQGQRFAGVPVDASSPMWNAGVIGLPGRQAGQLIALSLQLCDALCETASPRRLLEQFAFSLALNHLTRIQPCQQLVGHYWGNKSEWNRFITAFLAEQLLQGASLDECIARVRCIDWNRLPLEKRPHSSIERIKRWLDRVFRLKRTRYFGDTARPGVLPASD